MKIGRIVFELSFVLKAENLKREKLETLFITEHPTQRRMIDSGSAIKHVTVYAYTTHSLENNLEKSVCEIIQATTTQFETLVSFLKNYPVQYLLRPGVFFPLLTTARWGGGSAWTRIYCPPHRCCSVE